jgi:centrosomal protein CEP78
MLDHMSGLRRVTLNRNPLLADRGATFLAEVIEADLWIKGKNTDIISNHFLLL